MKNILKIMFVAIMAFGMFACNERKITEEELQKLESTLLKTEPVDAEAVPGVVEKFCQFVKENPEAITAPDWLFKALDLSVNFLEPKKTIEIGEEFVNEFPENDKAPMALFVLGSMVYDDQLHDLDKAREMYETILSKYPDSDFVPSVQAALKFLGLTPEEIVQEFEMMNDTVPAE